MFEKLKVYVVYENDLRHYNQSSSRKILHYNSVVKYAMNFC